VFGLVLAYGYDWALTPALDRAGLPEAARAALELQRGKLAGATVPADLSAAQQEAASAAIKSAFITGYRWAMVAAGAMALASALVALRFIRRASPAQSGQTGTSRL